MESFDYEQVKTKLKNLDSVFESFCNKLKDMDTKLTDSVNVEDGALRGVVAKSLLESWNNCSDRFYTFNSEFDILLKGVTDVSNNNASLEDEVMAMYGVSVDKTDTTPTASDHVVNLNDGAVRL